MEPRRNGFDLNDPSLSIAKVEEFGLVAQSIKPALEFTKDEVCQSHSGSLMSYADTSDRFFYFLLDGEELRVICHGGDRWSSTTALWGHLYTRLAVA